MNLQQLRRSPVRRPFQRFAMLPTDGRDLEIKHPENAELRDHRTVSVWTSGAGEAEVVDLLHVVSLRPLIEDEEFQDQDMDT